MDTINQQQPEENHADLQGGAAITKLKELVEKSPTCFFSTVIQTGAFVHTRPMSVQKVDDDGTMWFQSASGYSGQNKQLVHDPMVQLFFQASSFSDFLTVYGRATISTDRAKIKELWQPLLKTWFTGGVDDPRITAIRLVPDRGYYWSTKHNRAIVFAKMVIGAVIGKTLDDSIEGKLRL